MNNIITALAALAVDYYKPSHRTMYAQGTEVIYSSFTPRSFSRFKATSRFDNKMTHIGTQLVIKDYLIDEWNESFFNQPLQSVLDAYSRHMKFTLGQAAAETEHIEALHNLGYLPICIKTLPEGSRVPAKVPVFTIVNTLPDFFWLTNYLESVISAESWKIATVATTAYEFRRGFEYWADITGASKDFIQFQGHDFSFRGMSGRHDAMRSCIGHLSCFTGTDTALAVVGAEKWYNANIESELVGTSVPATEHSVMTQMIAHIKQSLDDKGEWYSGTCWYDIEGLQFDQSHTNTQRLAELAYIIYLITELYPTGVISIVADSFDFWYLMEFGLTVLKPYIESRKPCALGLNKVVFRPDSGNPVDIICGYKVYTDLNTIVSTYEHEYDQGQDSEVVYCKYDKYYQGRFSVDSDNTYELIEEDDFDVEITEAEAKGAMQCLYEVFGSTTNEAGYETLSPYVGLIYGDSITLDRQEAILSKLAAKKYATDCIVLGVGSYEYGMKSRDTLGFAMKATYSEINGSPINIYKDPKTDDGTKKSAKGLLAVVSDEQGNFTLKDECSKGTESLGCLQPVFKDGKLLQETSLAEIRSRLWN